MTDMSDFKRVSGRGSAALNQFTELSPWAATYIVAVAALAVFASYLGRAQGLGDAAHVGLAIGLAVAASIAQLSEVRTANNKAYVATISFFMAGTLLLPPIDAAGVVAVVFITELIVKSKKLYIAIFNICSQGGCTPLPDILYKPVNGPSGVTPPTKRARFA